MSQNREEFSQWTDDAEIVAVTLTLKAISTITMPVNHTIGLHAWFLNQIRDNNPELSRVLHDDQSRKAFAISPLIGNFEKKDNRLIIIENDICEWTISALSKPICDWLKTWCNHYPSILNFYAGKFVIEKISITLPATTYNSLWSTPYPKQSLFTLAFFSPTSFRHKHHHLPLPVPSNLFHSYLRRWNMFAPTVFSQSMFLDWIDQIVYITDYDLTCTKVSVAKQSYVIGFIGKVKFEIDQKICQNSS